jgi:hypothetical protein
MIVEEAVKRIVLEFSTGFLLSLLDLEFEVMILLRFEIFFSLAASPFDFCKFSSNYNQSSNYFMIKN